ncbi:Protein of unknown function [Gryllus bimaculatus]|nr:Protein of unknown function [Gryllus bimaculatus]
MAEFVSESEKDTDSERMNKIADDVIEVLRKLDEEYDSLVKSAEKRLESDGTRYEVKNCKNEKENFVHDVVEQGIAIFDKTQRRWEDLELSMKLAEYEEMTRILEKEKQTYVEKKSLFERRINIEKNKIDVLNEKIESALVIGNDYHNKELQLKLLMDELQDLSVEETLYPTAILELHSACTQLQARIENMEKDLLKYADLPPDYEKAREKLAEVMLQDQELERRIRNIIK